MADSVFRKNAAVVRGLITEAQSLEENKRYIEAYVKYLKCVEFISQALFQNAGTRDAVVVVDDIQFKQRLLSLAKTCLERSEEMLKAIQESCPSNEVENCGNAHHGSQNHGSQNHGNQNHGSQNHGNQNQHGGLIHQHSDNSHVLATRREQLHPGFSLPLNPEISATCPVEFKGVAPSPVALPRSDPGQHVLVDRAQHMNRKLMAIYQERMKRQIKGTGLPQGKEMSLGALRRLEETLSIAKAKEKDLQMKARRLQQLKQFDSTSEVSKAKTDSEKLSSAVTSYERLKARYFKLRAKLLKSPVSPATVKALLNEALEDKDHPLYKEFGKLQFFILEKLMVIVKELNVTRFLPWIEETDQQCRMSSSGGLSGEESSISSTANASLFTMSLQNRSMDHLSDQRRQLTSSAEHTRRFTSSSPSPPPPPPTMRVGSEDGNQGGHQLETEAETDPFDDKLASLRAALLSGDTGQDHQKDDMEEDVDEDDELMNELEKEIDSPTPAIVLLSPPSPVTTGDLSASDLREVFASHPDVVSTQQSEGAGMFAKCKLHLSSDVSYMEQLQQKAAKELPQLIREIQSALSALIQCVLTTYHLQDEQGEIRDVLEPLVERALFPPIWPYLLPIFRLKHYNGEVALATNMARHFECTPEDLQVREKFCLRKEPDTPYKNVVEEVKKLCSLSESCPTDKLAILVKASKAIFQTIEDYYNEFEGGNGPKRSGIGVDDILPVVCYVVMRTAKPQIMAELHALEEFISEGYILGEDGFCLTTFHTAVEYLKTSQL